MFPDTVCWTGLRNTWKTASLHCTTRFAFLSEIQNLAAVVQADRASAPHYHWEFPNVLRTPRPAIGVSRPLRARVSRECPSRCLWGPSGLGLRSVQKVSRERCPRHSGHTLGTLFGHSGARRPKSPKDTPRDSCNRPGGSQQTWLLQSWLFAIFTRKRSFALLCDLLRSFVFFFVNLRLRSFARFCVRPRLERPRLERPHLGTADTTHSDITTELVLEHVCNCEFEEISAVPNISTSRHPKRRKWGSQSPKSGWARKFREIQGL